MGRHRRQRRHPDRLDAVRRGPPSTGQPAARQAVEIHGWRAHDEIPTGKVRRATSTTAALGPSSARLAGRLLASLGRSPERAREVLEERHAEVADPRVEVLGNLRGGAMKLGQLASFVDVEFLPPEYRAIYQEKLAELRDAAPSMSWEKVRGVLEHEWEEPIDELFSSISHEAVAAASIGQVHRGVLADGREVAVKVQYPEIADALESDLELASVLIGLGKAIAPGLDPKLVAGELRERVLEELDFELEAQQQRTFARAYRGHPFVLRAGGRHVAVAAARARQRMGRRHPLRRDARSLDQERATASGRSSCASSSDRWRVSVASTPTPPGQLPAARRRADGVSRLRQHGRGRRPGPHEAGADGRGRGRRRRLLGAASELGYVRELSGGSIGSCCSRRRCELGDWYLKDRELRIDPDYVAAVISALIDPRAMEGAFRLIRQLKVPPEEIWLRRVETSVLAVLGQLRATRNWHRIMLELVFGDAPATELGRQESAFWSRRERRA